MIKPIILGLIQAITEFLPVSSSGHLRIAEYFLNFNFKNILSFEIALHKAGLLENDIDFLLGGDLNNQIAITSYAMKSSFIPYLGTFAACSTLTENLILASILVDANLAKNVMCVTSSHNATSERQFRYPTEYGGQKPESMTFTTTASASLILSNEKSMIKVTKGTVGKIIDVGLTDAQDMGRTMAPAAVVTLFNHLQNFNETIDDYDLVVTGDLSKYGSDIFEKHSWVKVSRSRQQRTERIWILCKTLCTACQTTLFNRHLVME